MFFKHFGRKDRFKGIHCFSIPLKKHRHESFWLYRFIDALFIEERFEDLSCFGISAFAEGEALGELDIRAMRASFESLIFKQRHGMFRSAFRA
jgi:hypothetical protein